MNDHITKYYVDQASGIFHGPMIQNGYGQKGGRIGNLLKKFMTWITPLAKKHLLPSIQTGVKTVGNHVVNSLADFAKDAISGKDFKEAANERYNEVVDTLKKKVEEKLEGNGFKQKRKWITTINKAKKPKNYFILKKTKKYSDIFD